MSRQRGCTSAAEVRQGDPAQWVPEMRNARQINGLRFATAPSVALELQPAAPDRMATATAPDGRIGVPEWFVVRTKAKREDYALLQLERRGVAAFLPRVLEYGRDQIAPLFPGYLFVHIVLLAQYYRVVWAPGVRAFVAFGEVPTPVKDSVVHLIRASAVDGVIRPFAPLKAGDRVQINGGPFAGLVAIIQRPCSPRGRVKILLDFLRQGISAELPVRLVDRI